MTMCVKNITTNKEISINKIISDEFPELEQSGIKTIDFVNQVLANMKNYEMTKENIIIQIKLTASSVKSIIENK